MKFSPKTEVICVYSYMILFAIIGYTTLMICTDPDFMTKREIASMFIILATIPTFMMILELSQIPDKLETKKNI